MAARIRCSCGTVLVAALLMFTMNSIGCMAKPGKGNGGGKGDGGNGKGNKGKVSKSKGRDWDDDYSHEVDPGNQPGPAFPIPSEPAGVVPPPVAVPSSDTSSIWDMNQPDADNDSGLDLVYPGLPGDDYSQWQAIQGVMLQALDDVSIETGAGTRCNGLARVWWRAVFHDAGTYNRTAGTGGMDGSLQYELDRPENSEATGIPAAISFFKSLQSTASGRPPSMADLITLSGLLSVAVCGGPQMVFTPGRLDATRPNTQFLLPSPQDGVDMLMASMSRMTFDSPEMVVLVGAGHTIAHLTGALDSTPQAFDNMYFKQLMGQASRPAPLTLPSDRNMLRHPELRSWVQRFADDQALFHQAVIPATYKMVYLGQPASVQRPAAPCGGHQPDAASAFPEPSGYSGVDSTTIGGVAVDLVQLEVRRKGERSSTWQKEARKAQQQAAKEWKKLEKLFKHDRKQKKKHKEN